MKYAIERGYDEILFLGMSGTRADHTLTNMLLLSKCKKAYMIDDDNEIYYIKDKIRIEDKKGKTLSIKVYFEGEKNESI